MNVLEAILESTRHDVQERRRVLPEAELERLALAVPPPGPGRLRSALSGPGIAVIAEHKRRSPSAGVIRAGASVGDVARAYEAGGATAMSVLTEEQHFAGSLDDLREARAAVSLPLLRKDFVVERSQLLEARLAGADAVLLITAALPPLMLLTLMSDANDLGLDALVEVHDLAELEVALAVGARLIGINNRDLRDFSVDVERTFSLLPHLPEDAVIVSESGIHDPEQLVRLQAAGVHAVLVGERVMREADPEAALRELLGR